MTPNAPPRPTSTSGLRAANTDRVIDALRGAGAERSTVTQASLARATGLAPATVSSIVAELSAAGVLETEPGSGRRGTVVRFAAMSSVVVSLDFGHSHVAVGVGDLAGSVLAQRRVSLEPEHHHAVGLDRADALMDEALAELGRERSAVAALSLGLPAPLSNGRMRAREILPGWADVEPRALAEQRWGLPVTVDNDANLSAVAEHRLGAARGHSDAVVVKISSGVGGGIIVGGNLVRGSSGMAGEIGHLTVDDSGPVCRCGSRGCLEAYASASAVQRMLAEQMPGASIGQIVDAAQDGHVAARRALEDTGLHLGWALASIVNLLNPSVCVVAGEIARSGDLLLDPARLALRRHALDASTATMLVPGQLQSDAPLLGGLLVAADSVRVL